MSNKDLWAGKGNGGSYCVLKRSQDQSWVFGKTLMIIFNVLQLKRGSQEEKTSIWHINIDSENYQSYEDRHMHSVCWTEGEMGVCFSVE